MKGEEAYLVRLGMERTVCSKKREESHKRKLLALTLPAVSRSGVRP
jgi:hypothetical protein